MTGFSQKAVVVTGAARGQGLAEVRYFAERGAHVLLCDVLEEEGRAAAAALRERDLPVDFHLLDVADAGAWSSLADIAAGRFGRLDCLVNNAGIINRTSLHGTDPDKWQRLMDINLTGAFLGIRALSPLMAQTGGGAIINISSNAGVSAHFDPAYTASKWGLRGLTRAAAMELAPQKIRVNSVCPGLVVTDLNVTATHLAPMIEATPLRRSASVEEIAALVGYLCSDEAGFITGEDVVIDGGLTAFAAYRSISEKAGLYSGNGQ